MVEVAANDLNQEISDMLGGKLSNHDEDEVEDELGAMEMEVSGRKLPDAPIQEPPQQRYETPERERRRLPGTITAESAEEPMLA